MPYAIGIQRDAPAARPGRPAAWRPGPTALPYITGIQVYDADIHPPAPGRGQDRPREPFATAAGAAYTCIFDRRHDE